MKRGGGWLRLHAALVYGFLYAPIFLLVILSFNSSRTSTVWKGFTLNWYVRLFQNRLLWEAVKNSLIIAAATAVIATALGTAAALALHRRHIPGRLWIEGLLYVPLVCPTSCWAWARWCCSRPWDLPRPGHDPGCTRGDLDLVRGPGAAGSAERHGRTPGGSGPRPGRHPVADPALRDPPLLMPAIVAAILLSFTL
ncbi:MAG: hypothetical protein A6D92_20770, partial [Symbiobacterium thermophilum]